MRILIIIFFLLLREKEIYSQGIQPNADDKKVKIVPQDTNIKVLEVPIDTNSKKILVKDTSAHEYNLYRGLLNDDPVYNKKYPWWQPALGVVAQNVLLNLVDHYLLHLDFPVVGFNSWKNTANPF